MNPLRIRRWQAIAVAACLGFVWSSAANADNTGSAEDLTWSPSSSLGLRFHSADNSFPGGDSDDQMFSAASAAVAQTNRWLREIDLRGSETETFSGAPGETVVMHLQDLRMGGNTVLTLDGAADTNYLIKIRNVFSLTGNAQIVLSGGLTWNDVTFKLRGTGEPVEMSGSSMLQGIVMARKRVVRLRNEAIIYGDAVGWINLSGSAQIIHPPIVSP
jgi:hypothetical protein